MPFVLILLSVLAFQVDCQVVGWIAATWAGVWMVCWVLKSAYEVGKDSK